MPFLWSDYPSDQAGQLYTLGLLEQLRAECKSLWGASSEAYFRVDSLLRELANPTCTDPRQPAIPRGAVGPDRAAPALGGRGIIKRRDRARRARHSDRELSQPAPHSAQRHPGDSAVSPETAW